MSPVLEISSFISFNDLGSSGQNVCIFITQKGTRCQNHCRKENSQHARRLRHQIMESSLNAMSLNLLIKYIQYVCCTRSEHTLRIKDMGLLNPLAQRWLDEIALPLSTGKSTASLKRETVHECGSDGPKAFKPDLGDDQSTTNSSHSHSAMSSGITKTTTIIEGTHHLY